MIVNKIQNSDLVLVDLEDFFPDPSCFLTIDLKDFLDNEWILKEKTFREKINLFLENKDFSIQYIGLFCSCDAILPQWAFLFFSLQLQAKGAKVFLQNKQEDGLIFYYKDFFSRFDFSVYQDKNIMLKGCGKKQLSQIIYLLFYIHQQKKKKK